VTSTMRALLLEAPKTSLRERRIAVPRVTPGQMLVRVLCCGVCRTDLHVLDGELAGPKLPLVLGHQIVGTVAELGAEVEGFKLGQRVGVPWLGSTCGECRYCRRGYENLCDHARFTGYQLDGGFAEYTRVDPRFALPLPGSFADVEVAPLLCAGLIGYRALLVCGDAECIGLYGFGSAAHIVAQVASYQGRRVFAFTKPGDAAAQKFALGLGAEWAGGSDEVPPVQLDAALIFAADGSLIPKALRDTGKGAVVVCAGIHMSEVPAFPYEILWGERTLRSVANLTRRDGIEFLELAPRIPVRAQAHRYKLGELNRALDDLREGRFSGSAVVTID
jgi:alcohol dehydrogenase, propanol-preferring